jgi:hypothetical protein
LSDHFSQQETKEIALETAHELHQLPTDMKEFLDKIPNSDKAAVLFLELE